jgi:hypothetical protein
MTEVEVTHGLIKLILWTVFIYCIIGQMQTQIIEIIFWRFLVFFSGQSGKTFLIEVYLERIDVFKQHINSEIKLKFLIKHRISYIFLDDGFWFRVNLRKMLAQVNASTLTTGFGLYNKGQLFAWLDFLFLKIENLFAIRRKQKSFGKKVILFRKVLSHRAQIYHK